jgi:GNAT superfamily N-acetyltransferase
LQRAAANAGALDRGSINKGGNMSDSRWDWLGGQLLFERGTRGDYLQLERFHYVPKHPATWAGVWRIVYEQRIVAVGVLSYPVPSCRARERALRLPRARYEPKKIRWLNANLRTISRVIIHPQFRGVGLASALVRHICNDSNVSYIEAMATMAKAVPFFDRAGMKRAGESKDGATYYLWKRPRQGGNYVREVSKSVVSQAV